MSLKVSQAELDLLKELQGMPAGLKVKPMQLAHLDQYLETLLKFRNEVRKTMLRYQTSEGSISQDTRVYTNRKQLQAEFDYFMSRWCLEVKYGNDIKN